MRTKWRMPAATALRAAGENNIIDTMLVIREAQLAAFDIAAVKATGRAIADQEGFARRTIEAFAVHLHHEFAIHAEADVRQMVDIARHHGFDFDAHPENAWMIDMLRDPQVSSISRRVSRLAAESERRARLARHNAEVERALAGVGGGNWPKKATARQPTGR